MDTNNCKDNTEYINTFYSNQYLLTGDISITPEMTLKKLKSVKKSTLLELISRLFDMNTMLVVCETK
jgi:hypothetical protein